MPAPERNFETRAGSPEQRRPLSPHRPLHLAANVAMGRGLSTAAGTVVKTAAEHRRRHRRHDRPYQAIP